MIISQWTAKSDDCPDCGDPWCMGCKFNVQADASRTDRVEIDELPPLDGDEYAVTLDAEMVANLNVERELNGNLSGDPIARGLTSDEEDAEVGRLWGIDASRVEDGE